MTVPFMDAYVRLLISTCHHRGVHAMGGMAALIPIKNNEEANAKAMANVRADKLREALAGHDGTWVAHPALAPIAEEVFNTYMPTANQTFRRPPLAQVTRDDLLNPNVPGNITIEGVKKNIHVCLVYIEAWLRGIGCSPINYLMVSNCQQYFISTNFYRRTRPPLKYHEVSSGSGLATKPVLSRAFDLTRL